MEDSIAEVGLRGRYHSHVGEPLVFFNNFALLLIPHAIVYEEWDP